MTVLHGQREILISSYNTIISALEHRNGVNFASLDQLYKESDAFTPKLKFIVRKIVYFVNRNTYANRYSVIKYQLLTLCLKKTVEVLKTDAPVIENLCNDLETLKSQFELEENIPDLISVVKTVIIYSKSLLMDDCHEFLS